MKYKLNNFFINKMVKLFQNIRNFLIISFCIYLIITPVPTKNSINSQTEASVEKVMVISKGGQSDKSNFKNLNPDKKFYTYEYEQSSVKDSKVKDENKLNLIKFRFPSGGPGHGGNDNNPDDPLEIFENFNEQQNVVSNPEFWDNLIPSTKKKRLILTQNVGKTNSKTIMISVSVLIKTQVSKKRIDTML